MIFYILHKLYHTINLFMYVFNYFLIAFDCPSNVTCMSMEWTLQTLTCFMIRKVLKKKATIEGLWYKIKKKPK